MPRRLTFAQLSVRQQPLIYFAVAFIVGEILAAHWHGENFRAWLLATIFLFVAVIALVILKKVFWQRDALITLILLANCCACGGLLWSLNAAGVAANRIEKLFAQKIIDAHEPVEIWGVVSAAPELAPDRIYLDVKIERIATLGQEQNAVGVVRLIVPVKETQDRADYDALAIDYGVRIRALALLRKSVGFRNPGATNFDELLAYRGYDATGLIKSPLLIERLNIGARNFFLHWLYGLRANAIAVILRSFTQPTAGILAAALFGNQHFLSHETAESFRIGGTFHLLVISGLHVAMLALVVTWLVKKITRVRWLQFTSVMILLWAYSLMVGAQPAITRATVMLTVVLIGQLIFRTAPGANTLAAAALVLLVWQPRDVFNPGFQLSFLTVAMIVLVTVPLLERLKNLGEWQPSVLTPYPPRVPQWLQWCAEILYWNEVEFAAEMRKAPIRYKLEKAAAARWFSATRWRRIWQQVLRWTITTLLATVLVQIGLLPMMIAQFHRVSFVAPLTNALQGALMFALMLTGAAYLLVYALFGAMAMKLAWIINAIGWLTAHAADKLLLWRKLNFRVPDYGANSVWIYTAYFFFVFILIIALNHWNPFALARNSTTQRTKIFALLPRPFVAASGCTLLALCVVLIWHPHQHEFARGRLSITFLDVGQGDAMLLSFPNGKLLLLDSGGKIPTDLALSEADDVFIEDSIGVGEAAVAPYLWQRGIKQLDFIAASHGHSDHTQGFADIGNSFTVSAALTGVIPTNDLQFSSFKQAATNNHAALQSIARGDTWEIDGVKIAALAPFQDAMKAEVAANNQSLVLRVQFGKRTFLLTGDIEKEIETRLVAAQENLQTDVLKVAHHGSRSSSTAEFLARTQAHFAVISVADPSPFDHPHQETIAGLQKLGAKILPTSQCGAITISTNGEDLRMETFVKCE